MNAIMENIKLPGANSDLNSLKEKLNRKFDVIQAAGTVLEMSGECTQLQSAIGELLLSPTYTFAGKMQILRQSRLQRNHFLTHFSFVLVIKPVVILLAAQSENLPDSCAKTFLFQCRELFCNEHSIKHLILSHKEGNIQTAREVYDQIVNSVHFLRNSPIVSTGICRTRFISIFSDLNHANSSPFYFNLSVAYIVCQKLIHLSHRLGQPKLITRTLMHAALSLAPESTVLTPIHSLFLQVLL
jgi:hypothetical protein